MATTATSAGMEFAQAHIASDFERIRKLLDPEVDFRALTPNRAWEAKGPDAVIEVLREWHSGTTDAELEEIETANVANCSRLGYRWHGRDEDGPFVVEQQAYLEERDWRISWMRILCSGQRAPL